MSQSTVFVYTMNRIGQVGAWTRYVFPFVIDDYTVLGEDMYLRSGNTVRRLTYARESDEMIVPAGDSFAIEAVPFQWMFQSNWLDMGRMSVTKMLVGFDIVGTGNPTIEFGYNQANGGLFTPPWEIPADSVPGQILMASLLAPSLALRITYTGDDVGKTGFEALNLWFNDMRPTS